MKFFILTSLLFSISAIAGEPMKGNHELVCYDEISTKKISIKIGGIFPDKYENAATVYISNSIATPPYQVITTTITNVQVDLLKLDLVGTENQYITDLKLNLGRSGYVTIKLQSVYGESDLNSTMREFLYFQSNMKCSYGFALGPKPFSGGN